MSFRLGSGVPVLGLAMVLVGCSGSRPPVARNCVADVAADRQAKDMQFLEEDDPVPRNRKAELLPLAYFEVDAEYCVPAALKPAPEETIVEMPTSTGELRRQRIVGTMEFVLKGQPQKLLASADADAPNLNLVTVMFSDLTTGTETYPGGRYIEFSRNPQGIYELDFNRAFNPYCYYNASYSCPYPPPENRLKVPIRAGERLKN